MWYFLIRQDAIEPIQYRQLQQRVNQTEVELFNEPYGTWYVFTVEKEEYSTFMDHLDREGISYELAADRPTREELLERMR
ncbi:hypothetical protein [Spirosoma sp. KUDC1026]|uniref:hypothetical protein n=1 Tax=Spirosoma sp. KUDC1026 TaxID=2745947 RepID=UPI00159BBE41|nr:hypothetical protein [Spirosoma sp. KUDC1026]QKZ12764.1 hypothetical protein HU175_09025 [Spirosoma sp. KUDC1026]